MFIALVLLTLSYVNGFAKINPYKMHTKPIILPETYITSKNNPINYNSSQNKLVNIVYNNDTLDEKYQATWFVVEESKNILANHIYTATIREKEYIYWKDRQNRYTALEASCNHRGAALRHGKIAEQKLICPYHGAEFDQNGKLCKIPGLDNNIKIADCFHQETYPIQEIHGWVYLNTVSKRIFQPQKHYFFLEKEAKDPNYCCIFLHNIIHAPNRIVSENLLDVIHISYVHTFGNSQNPLPLNDPQPFQIPDIPNHYGIHYQYKSGPRSFVNQAFGMADLRIENEFILPYTVISRVTFGRYTKTIITFALPETKNRTRLFMKVYRNFVYRKYYTIFGMIYNYIMNQIIIKIVRDTIAEDARILENINLDKVDGKYNVKYDRFPYMYRKLYEKHQLD